MDPEAATSVIKTFTARDGLALAYRQLGEGRPLILLHGFLSDGRQWIDHSHAAAFAGRGHQVIVPDLRGHGASARPHEAAAYPPDVLADDGLALVETLGLDRQDGAYDLAGYSLGARVLLRMLVRGARPAKAVIAGQGLDVIDAATSRTPLYRRVLTAMVDGSPLDPQEQLMAGWLARSDADPQALLLVLDSMVATPPEALDRITVPALVVIGEQDARAGDALASAIPAATLARVPGGHDAFTRQEFATAVLAFLHPTDSGGRPGG